MNLNELANAVARKADTKGTEINVAEVRRVQGLIFEALAELPTADALDLVVKGLKRASKK